MSARHRVCEGCGELFPAADPEAGSLQTRLCAECLEEKLLELGAVQRDIHGGWFRALGFSPASATREDSLEVEEFRICTRCGMRFRTFSSLRTRLCTPCLDEELRMLPPDAHDTPASPAQVKALLSLAVQKR